MKQWGQSKNLLILTYLTRRFIKSQYQFLSLYHHLRTVWTSSFGDLFLVVKRIVCYLVLMLNAAACAKLIPLSKGCCLTCGAGRVHWEAEIWEGGWGHFDLSELILRVMAPGVAQHFCRGDERALDFMFPGSGRLQSYCPQLLFLVTLNFSRQKCISYC